MQLPIPPQLPEPRIYSPAYELSLGNAPTWFSPDMFILQQPTFGAGQWSYAGGPVVSNPSAILWNSAAIAAVNVPVSISCSPQGIGFPKAPLYTLAVPVIPADGSFTLPIPYSAAMLAAEPLGAKLPAIYVDINPTYDSNFDDNHGAFVYDAHIVAAGLTIGWVDRQLRINNSQASEVAFNFAIVGPNELGASIPPGRARVVMAPNSQNTVAVVQYPPGISARSDNVTVIATNDSGALIGGCSLGTFWAL